MPVYSYAYSIPYLIFLFYFVILLFFEFRAIKFEKDTKYIRWAAIIGFVFFFGFRGFIFTDWMMYYPLFNKLPTIWDGGILSVLNPDFTEEFVSNTDVGKAGIELGFVYFTILFKSIIPDYHAWILFNTIIDVILLNIFIKRYSSYYVLSFIFFVAFGGLIIECNLMRNVKAILLFLISIKYLQERRIVPYMLLNLVGLMFHSSAIVYFPLYFILQKQWPQWLLWSIFIIGNVVFLLQIKYLEPILLSFANLVGGRMGVQIKLYFVIDLYSKPFSISYGYVEQVITFLLLIFNQKKLIEQKPENIIFINSYVLYFIIYFFFAEIMVAIERLTLLFIFSYWILYPEIFKLVRETMNKMLLIITLIGYCCMKLVLMNCNVFSRYDNLLFGIENFDERSLKVYNDLDRVLEPK
jgi:hypothetical protein